MQNYDGVLAGLRERAEGMEQSTRENENLLLELLKLGETHIEQDGIYGEIVLYAGRREDTPEENA